MTLKTGSADYVFPAHSRVTILAEDRVSVLRLDAANEPVDLVAGGRDTIKLRIGDEDVSARVVVPEGHHWSIEVDEPKAFDKADPVPMEPPEGTTVGETLEAKLRKFLGSMVAERYGKDAEEFDTLEEALDFDIDGDGEIGEGTTVYERMAEEAPPVDPREPVEKAAAAPEEPTTDGGEAAGERTEATGSPSEPV